MSDSTNYSFGKAVPAEEASVPSVISVSDESYNAFWVLAFLGEGRGLGCGKGLGRMTSSNSHCATTEQPTSEGPTMFFAQVSVAALWKNLIIEALQ